MKSLAELNQVREEAREQIRLRIEQPAVKITIGAGTAAIAAGARKVSKLAIDIAERQNIDLNIVYDSLADDKDNNPVVIIRKRDTKPVRYNRVTAEGMRKIMEQHIVKGNLVAEFLA